MKRLHTADTQVKPSITPLIDVTFLLLIFFMCAMRFKTLDRKVEAWMPKDRGDSSRRVNLEQERIRLRLTRDGTPASTRVELLGDFLGSDRAGFQRLGERVARIQARLEGDSMPGEIDAAVEVPHGDVVRAVDAFLLAGITEIYFGGRRRGR